MVAYFVQALRCMQYFPGSSQKLLKTEDGSTITTTSEKETDDVHMCVSSTHILMVSLDIVFSLKIRFH